MKKQILFILSFFLIGKFVFAQSCKCSEQFQFLTEKINANYPGLKDKITSETVDDFNRHTEKYKSLAEQSKADSTCFRLLKEWSAWLKDRHVQLGINNNSSEAKPEEIRERFSDWKKTPFSEKEIKTKLEESGRDSIEGIWASDDGSYQVAILRKENSEDEFIASVIKADSVWWTPGQVKFELKKEPANEFSIDYYMRDHSKREKEGKRSGLFLHVSSLGSWVRIFPGTPGKFPPPSKYAPHNLKMINENTLLITMPSMNHNFQKQFEQLVKDNKNLIESTPNLIIDCRNNGGGSDLTYFPIRRYIYTSPYELHHMQVYSTEDNIRKFRGHGKDKSFSWKDRMYFKWKARKLERNRGKMVGKSGKEIKKKRWNEFFPKKVGILINSNCASSCEQFVLFARQSKKVTLFGENTGGVLDYANMMFLDFPCGGWYLGYPTSRSSRVDTGEGIDNIGIPPNVPLDEKSGDWVEFAKKYLEKN